MGTIREIQPQQVNESTWILADAKTLEPQAYALLADGEWRATVRPSLCGGLINFMSVAAATPELALVGVFVTNIKMMKRMAEELEAIHQGIEFNFDDPVNLVALAREPEGYPIPEEIPHDR